MINKILIDALFMSIGAVIMMLIMAQGELKLGFEAFFQISFAVGIGFTIRAIVGKILNPSKKP